ncbi:hypothetical protein [Bacillus sp. AK031]
MNINGMVRGYMKEIMNDEDFLKHVAVIIERQLQEWDVNYEVLVMKFKDYELVVKNWNQEYQINLTEQEIDVLKSKGLFKLDQRIWTEMIDQGLTLQKEYGNYLSKVLQGKNEL